MFSFQLFTDLVNGNLGDSGQQEGSSKIVGVVFAGNSLSKDTQSKDSLTKVRSKYREPFPTYIIRGPDKEGYSALFSHSFSLVIKENPMLWVLKRMVSLQFF